MNNKIICLLGMSAAGKDTTARLFKYFYNIDILISHTTRPIRSNEKDKEDYYFISNKEMENMINNQELIEYRTYNTIQNGKQTTWQYGLSKKEVDNKLNKNHVIACVDLTGYNDLLKYVGKDRIIPIYIHSNYDNRLLRAIARDKNFERKEFDRRYQDDLTKFADLNSIKAIANTDLSYYFYEVTKYLKSQNVIDEAYGTL